MTLVIALVVDQVRMREKTKMVLAIVRKELRETWLFAVLAVGLYLIYLSRLTGDGVAAHFPYWLDPRHERGNARCSVCAG